jgi:F-type H+-transporting ATPase subunit delta
VTNKSAANRYARALLEVAIKEHGDLARIETDLAAFVDLFTAHPALARVLLNPAVPVARKQSAVSEVVALAGTAPMLAKLLNLLAERDRLVVLPDLLVSYRDRLREHQGVVSAEVTTAAPLAGDRVKAIEQSLAAATGAAVILETKVDASIVGGVVARVGSVVYDGSVTRQLERIRKSLTDAV